MLKKEFMTAYVRRGIFALIILLAAILQNTKGLFPEIVGIRAWLLIPVVACLGMFERELIGAVLGAFAGLLWDMVSTSFCYNSIMLLLIGCICGLMITHFMRNNLVTALLLNGVSIAIYGFVHWLIFVAFTIDSPLKVLLKFYLPCMLYTFVLFPLIYVILRQVMKSLRSAE